MFQLDPRLRQDTLTLGDLDLCRLLLMNDATLSLVYSGAAAGRKP